MGSINCGQFNPQFAQYIQIPFVFYGCFVRITE